MGAERRWGDRAGDAARAILKVMLFGLVPFVAFFNITRLELTADVGAGIGIGIVALLCAGAIAYVVGTRVLHLERPSTGVLVNTALQGNTGYLGYPLCVALLGADRLPEAVAYDALAQGPVLLLGVFGVGAAMGTQAGESRRERILAFVRRNPPLLAVVAGLLAPDALAPDALVDLSRLVVFALLPLGFFAVGVILAQESGDGRLSFPPAMTRPVAASLVLRLLVAPALLAAFAAPFIDLPEPYLLLAAMPAGINGLVVAHAYGLDLGFAAAAIAWSTTVVVIVALIVTGVA